MNLKDWELTVEVYKDAKEVKITDGRRADADTDFKYRTIHIRFFSKAHLDKKDVLRTIQHELGHAYHAGFDWLLKQINVKFDSKESMELLGEMRSIAEESTACLVSNVDLGIK